MRMRPVALSFQTATPRCTKPVPLGGCPSSKARGSYFHFSAPVAASTATTRLYGVEKYNVSPIISGVVSNCPGNTPRSFMGASPLFHCHASFRPFTLEVLINASGEYLLLPESPPFTAHSVLAARANNPTDIMAITIRRDFMELMIISPFDPQCASSELLP